LKTMPSIILPSQPRRAWLLGFWLSICALTGSTVALFLLVAVSPGWAGLVFVVAVLVALVGFMQPDAILAPYRLWNNLARFFARGARFLIMGVCYFVIFAIVRLAGSSLRLAPPAANESLWTPKMKSGPDEYAYQYHVSVEAPSTSSWVPSYISWAKQSANWWALSLLPFLTILSLLDEDGDKAFPPNLYTLF